MPPRSKADSKSKRSRKSLDKNSDEYLARRERNNIAVKKSREKSRAKNKGTAAKVNMLKKENMELEQQVTILSKELGVLKDLFRMVHSTGDIGLPGVSGSGSNSNSATVLPPVSEVASHNEEPSYVEYAPAAVKEEEVVTTVNTDALKKDHEYFSTRI